MNIETLETLYEFFSRFPFMKANPVSVEEIDAAERKLGVRFSERGRMR